MRCSCRNGCNSGQELWTSKVATQMKTERPVYCSKDSDPLCWATVSLAGWSYTCAYFSTQTPQTKNFMYFVDRASRYKFCWPWISLQILLTVHLVTNFVDSASRYKFCWQCISLQILSNNQPDALFHVLIYFISLHVSSITVLIIRRSKCINTSSGMISLCKWLLGMPVRREQSSLLTGIPSSHLHRLIIPDDVLIHFDLLMMSTVMLETCREMK